MPPKPQKVREFMRRGKRLFRERIWEHEAIAERSWRGKSFALLRIGSVTITGTVKNKIFSQAAALGYASLLSLGPIVSLIIIITSFILQKNSDKFATETLNQIVTFIAPSATEFARATQPDDTAVQDTAAGGAIASKMLVYNEKVVNILDHLVVAARSKTVGVVGLVVLIFIALQMIVSIETNFNSIWGVRRGRDLSRRVVLYWTVFSLGILMIFTAGTFLSATSLRGLLSHLPLGLDALDTFGLFPKLAFYTILALLLALFYRFIPNTYVHWKPALVGGAVVAGCLILNNYLSFLYVDKVLTTKSLYGSVGIIPILMFGLYVFWLLILLGGQLTYAVQNADSIADDRLWNEVSPRTRRVLCLAAFMNIARNFVHQTKGPTADDLVQSLQVPANMLNQCLNRLTDMQFVSPIEVTEESGEMKIHYQPGRPLHQLTLGQFQHSLDILGHVPSDDAIEEADPVLPLYLQALTRFEDGPVLQRTFAQLLDEENPAAGTAAQAEI